MIKMRPILGLLAILVGGFESFKMPQPLVNMPGNDSWVWFSLPEDNRISSVLYYTEYGEDRCPAYNYKFDPDLVHPWAIKEYLNETLKISAIVQTKENETFAETFSVTSKGSEVQAERVMRKCNPPGDTTYTPFNRSQIIFSFNDKQNLFTNWKHVVQSQLQVPHYEGVAFVNDRANSFIENNMLYLRVTRSNYTVAKPFYLKDCTFQSEKRTRQIRCGTAKYNPSRVRYIPPYLSAKLRSKYAFKYGKVQIRAKLPIGNLLFPGLQLTYDDGDDEDNGDDAIRIAIVRGNRNLSDYAGNEIGGSRVFAGAIYIDNKMTQIHEKIEYADLNDHFGSNFHTYTVIWKEKNIIFKVDGRRITTITGKIAEALSEKKRHIELFLTVGGEYNFPDSRIPSHQKMYRNSDINLSYNVKRAVEIKPDWEQAEMVIKSINVQHTKESEE